MPGTMSRADLRADLKGSLHDAGSVLADPDDFDRCLNVAADALGEALPRTLASTLSLVAGQSEYAAPADLLGFKASTWGHNGAKPWEAHWPGRLPRVEVQDSILLLTPAPTAAQIGLLGATFRFFYFAGYTVADDAANTTVPPIRRGLLLLRAQAEACRELALRNVAKPVSMRDGMSNQPRNGTPTHLFETMLREFDDRVRR